MTHDCAHAHAASPGLAGAALVHELSAARDQCAARGQRLTRPRERVLELLLRAGHPVKPYDLLAGAAPGEGSAKPPTVYRALEFLAAQGLAHRIESLGAFVACRRRGGHNAAFLICDCCGLTREFDPGEERTIGEAARRDGFTLSAVTLEAHGLCADCRDAAAA